MTKGRQCAECKRKRERCRAVTQRLDGSIEWVCPQCWSRLEYDDFIKAQG